LEHGISPSSLASPISASPSCFPTRLHERLLHQRVLQRRGQRLDCRSPTCPDAQRTATHPNEPSPRSESPNKPGSKPPLPRAVRCRLRPVVPASGFRLTYCRTLLQRTGVLQTSLEPQRRTAHGYQIHNPTNTPLRDCPLGQICINQSLRSSKISGATLQRNRSAVE
jgi:hypothetical protein